MNIYLDTETIGTNDPAVIAGLAAEIAPPKTMSKPETIAKWEAEEKPGLIAEAVRKTSFDGGVGRIVCLSWAVNGEEPQCAAQEDEGLLLTTFFAAISGAVMIHYQGGKTNAVPVFVGHNISGFDLRFLWQRSVVHRLKPPTAIPFNVRPWDKSLNDTMLMWNPERDKKISLDRLCKLLGIESPKGELDGSKVWDYVKAGRIAEVAEYCKRDVTAIRQCHRRMAFFQ